MFTACGDDDEDSEAPAETTPTVTAPAPVPTPPPEVPSTDGGKKDRASWFRGGSQAD